MLHYLEENKNVHKFICIYLAWKKACFYSLANKGLKVPSEMHQIVLLLLISDNTNLCAFWHHPHAWMLVYANNQTLKHYFYK